MAVKIKKWGNSAAIRLPSGLLESVNLGIDSEIKLSVSEGKIIIEPLNLLSAKLPLPFTESALIESIDDVSDDDDLLPNILDSELGEK